MIAEFGVPNNDLATIQAAHRAWGSVCTETQVNANSDAGNALGALSSFDVIANHIMAAPGATGGRRGSPRVSRTDAALRRGCAERERSYSPELRVSSTSGRTRRHSTIR